MITYTVSFLLKTAPNANDKIEKAIYGLDSNEIKGLEELQCIKEVNEFFNIKGLKDIETRADFIKKVYEVIKSYNNDKLIWKLENPETNESFDLANISKSGLGAVSGIQDLIRFITWLHLQDLVPTGVNNKIINQQFKSDHPLKENGYVMIVFNDFRRSQATQWANSLLLSNEIGTVSDIMPNFDFALDIYLKKENFRKGSTIKVSEFMDNLSKEYPWIMQGKIGKTAIQEVIETQSLPWWKNDYDSKYIIQPSVSKSLLIAQEEKKIELIPPKDDDNSKNYILSVTNEPCLNLKVLNPMVKVLKGYKCWDQDTIDSYLDGFQAESKDNYQLFSVNTKFPVIEKVNVEKGHLGDVVGESNFEELVNAFNDNKVKFVCITGDSGSGKTHLIELMSRKWEEEKENLGLHKKEIIVKLDRDKTNLKKFIETLISYLPKPNQKKYLSQLQELDDTISQPENELRERLLFELTLLIESNIESVSVNDPNKDKTIQHRKDILRPFLAYLNNQDQKDYFLGDDKVIAKYVREIKEGKEFDEDNDYKFQESDLMIEDIDIDKLQNTGGQLIGQFIAKFYSERSVFKKICLDLVNQNLKQACQNLYKNKGVDVLDLVKEIREEFYKQEKDILLVIQDLSTHMNMGLRELFQAVISEPSKGDPPLANIRFLQWYRRFNKQD